jgi:hypothetical protein
MVPTFSFYGTVEGSGATLFNVARESVAVWYVTLLQLEAGKIV